LAMPAEGMARKESRLQARKKAEEEKTEKRKDALLHKKYSWKQIPKRKFVKIASK